MDCDFVETFFCKKWSNICSLYWGQDYKELLWLISLAFKKFMASSNYWLKYSLPQWVGSWPQVNNWLLLKIFFWASPLEVFSWYIIVQILTNLLIKNQISVEIPIKMLLKSFYFHPKINLLFSCSLFDIDNKRRDLSRSWKKWWVIRWAKRTGTKRTSTNRSGTKK